MLYRYSERRPPTSWISGRTCSLAQEDRIVRVAANQSGNPWTIRQVLGFGSTTQRLDAIASAPYFYGNVDDYEDTPESISQYFVDMKADLDDRIDLAFSGRI